MRQKYMRFPFNRIRKGAQALLPMGLRPCISGASGARGL